MPSLSVVIPAFNEERYLPATIASFRKAEAHLGEPIEIVIGDNMSTDNTAQVARDLGAKVVQVEKKCISAVRNGAVAASSGDYLAFCDADDQVSENMLTEIKQVLDSGRYIGGGVGNVQVDRRSLGTLLTYRMPFKLAAWSGVSMAMFYTTREIYDAIGGFDETKLTVEDYDFGRRLKQEGRRRKLRYNHINNASLTKSTRKCDEFGDYFFLLKPHKIVGAFLGHRAVLDEFWYRPNR